MLKSYWVTLFCCVFGVSVSGYAADAQVTITEENKNLKNTTTITTKDGYGLLIDGSNPFDVIIKNEGSILATGYGFGIYEKPYPTIGVNIKIENIGKIQRIQLEGTDGANILNGKRYSSDQTSTTQEQAIIQGAVLLGKNATIANFGGVFENITSPSIGEKENTILFGYNGLLNNGVETIYETNDQGETILADVVFHNSKITTDNVILANKGVITNGSNFSAKNVLMGDDSEIFNIGEAFMQDYAGEVIPNTTHAIAVETIKMGKNAHIYNEMGTSFTANSVVLGSNAEIINGAEYSLIYNNELVVVEKVETEEGTIESKEQAYQMPEIPHGSTMNIKNLTVGDGSKFISQHNSQYTGETISFGKNGVLDVLGSSVSVKKDETSGGITFEEGGTLSIKSFFQEQIISPYLSEAADTDDVTSSIEEILSNGNLWDDIYGNVLNDTLLGILFPTLTASESTTTGTTTSTTSKKIIVDNKTVLPESIYVGNLETGNIIMKNNATLDIKGGNLKANQIVMGENSTIKLAGEAFQINKLPFQVGVKLEAADGIYFGNNGKMDVTIPALPGKTEAFTPEGATLFIDIDTPIVSFGDNGVFDLKTETLNVGSETSSDSSDSLDTNASGENKEYKVNLNPLEITQLSMGDGATINIASAPLYTDAIVGSNSSINLLGGDAQLKGSLIKRNNAKNVVVNSSANNGYLGSIVKVDNIIIHSGNLHMDGHIWGNVDMSDNTTLTLEGSNTYIYDPIKKLTEDTKNTTIVVDMEDDSFFTTLNTIQADHMILKGGGVELTRQIDIGDIRLDSDTTLRMLGNFHIGDLKEVDDDSVNTTLEIKVGEGRSVDSSGKVLLDRILLTSGNFNAFHEIDVTKKIAEENISAPYESGIELGSNTSFNAFANVRTNQIARNQSAIKKGEKVENTTLNINDKRFIVERNIDVDNLNINKGIFEFMNKDARNVANVTNEIKIQPRGALVGAGLLNVKSGKLDLKNDASLGVSSMFFKDKAIDELNVISSNETIEYSTDSYTKKDLTVNMEYGARLDVRANETKSDKINISGTMNLADGVRVIVRDIKANQEYELLSATQLNGNIDKLRTSFLWEGEKFSKENNTLKLKISGVKTLLEGIESEKPSENAKNIARALTQIKDNKSSYAIDPFLDNVFYADTAKDATQFINEYSAEGYLNTVQGVLKTQDIFKQSISAQMDAMRVYRVKNRTQKGVYIRNPYYYGKPGYEREYYSFRSNATQYTKTRSDRGGIWAKPFMVSASQDEKENNSGYDFDSYGITAGIDRKIGSVSFGVAALYATGEMAQTNKTIETDMTTYGFGVYGSVMPHYSHSFMNFYALWGQTSNDSTHKIDSLGESAKADFEISSFSIGADWGYEVMLANNLVLTPKIGIDYTSLEIDDIEEKGSGYARTRLKGTDLKSIKVPLEIKAGYDFANHVYRFKPEVYARWTHEFGDTAAQTTAEFLNYAQPYKVSGLNVDEDTFTIGGSLLWLYGTSELELRYNYDFSSSATAHTINMGYKYLF